MQESFLDTLKIVPSGVLIIDNKDDSIKFANRESLNLLVDGTQDAGIKMD